jgi:hypothetical protein
MGNTKSVLIRFDIEFYENVRRAAELNGMVFSDFVRMASKDAAVGVYKAKGIELPDLSGWHLASGGDFSEIRAAKDPNYKKRTLSDKISKAEEKAKKRLTNKGEANNEQIGQQRL